MATLQVRVMTLADTDAVGELYDALDLLHIEQLPWLFARPERSPRRRRFFAGVLGSLRSTLIVATDDDVVVGFVQVELATSPNAGVSKARVTGRIDAIFVAPTHRRGGAAVALLRAAEAWATERGAAAVELNVYAFNGSAREAFARMGYAPLSYKMSKATDRELG